MLFLGLNGRPGAISRDVPGNARFSAHAAGLIRGRSVRQSRPHLRRTSCSAAPFRSNTADRTTLHEGNNGAHAPHGWHCLQSPRSWKASDCSCTALQLHMRCVCLYEALGTAAISQASCKHLHAVLTSQHNLNANANDMQMLEEDSMFKMQLPKQLTPTWKMLLLSDGSVTRHLQLLTGQHIDVVRRLTHVAYSLFDACPALIAQQRCYDRCSPAGVLPKLAYVQCLVPPHMIGLPFRRAD